MSPHHTNNNSLLLPEHNTVPITYDLLVLILADFSKRILKRFGRQIRLVIHGGAVLLLHPTLRRIHARHSTRDLDYISRSFVAEWMALGVPDASAMLQECIDATARRFRLGRDWANSDADVALPMAPDALGLGPPYDPIYVSSVHSSNIAAQTVYNSPGLLLIAVPPPWGVALKIARYSKDDANDICAILKMVAPKSGGAYAKGAGWTPDSLERWLWAHCWSLLMTLGYAGCKLEVMRVRFQDVIGRLGFSTR